MISYDDVMKKEKLETKEDYLAVIDKVFDEMDESGVTRKKQYERYISQTDDNGGNSYIKDVLRWALDNVIPPNLDASVIKIREKIWGDIQTAQARPVQVLSFEEQLMQRWDNDSQIRAEFLNDFSLYKSYMRHASS